MRPNRIDFIPNSLEFLLTEPAGYRYLIRRTRVAQNELPQAIEAIVINRGQNDGHWYDGVTRYQWLVLIIASLGWVFDVFEGQIFVASMNEAMPSLLPDEVKRLDEKTQDGYKAFYNNVALTSFLAGGACGGILFGRLSDRVGRTGTMILTIAVYSAFTFLSALSQAWWHLALFRFLVAIGVGGEWAVASALVAEV